METHSTLINYFLCNEPPAVGFFYDVIILGRVVGVIIVSIASCVTEPFCEAK